MLALTFEAAGERYALRATAVTRVVPWAPLRGLPGAPAWMSGLLRLGDALVPILDLGCLLSGAPCRRLFATRIALVEHRRGGEQRAVGLLAERMTEVVELPEHGTAAIAVPGQPWLGEIVLAAGRSWQLVEPRQLLGAEVESLLFGVEQAP